MDELPDPVHFAAPDQSAFDRLMAQVHEIGTNVLRTHAEEVDRDARFPREAFEALRRAKLLSAYVPRNYGGMNLNILQVAKVCQALGQFCASSGLIYAMHQIQVACIVHHARQSAYFAGYLRQLVEEQRLIASATTELGVGGDLRTSLCAAEIEACEFKLTKKAPVISYCESADDILATCRRSSTAAASDQVLILLHRGDFTAAPLSGWNTLGFRGTCSLGFTLQAKGQSEQVLPTCFAEILTQTMHPLSHLVWSSVWSGLAADAVNRARAFVRAEARKTPGETPLCALRLAELDQTLQEMRQNVAGFAREYLELLTRDKPEEMSGYGFAIRANNLKLSSSQLLIDIVGRAMLICGIAGYRNDSAHSLGRHLRDAYGAALMVNNDRILKLNANMLMVHKEE